MRLTRSSASAIASASVSVPSHSGVMPRSSNIRNVCLTTIRFTGSACCSIPLNQGHPSQGPSFTATFCRFGPSGAVRLDTSGFASSISAVENSSATSESRRWLRRSRRSRVRPERSFAPHPREGLEPTVSGQPSISTSASQFTGAFKGMAIPIDERAWAPASGPYSSSIKSE